MKNMPAAGHGPVLNLTAIEDIGLLRQLLRDANYTPAGLAALLGSIEPCTDWNRPRLLRITGSGTRLDTLVRLFLFGVPVEAETLRQALLPVPLETLEEMGLLTLADGGATGTVFLLPYEDLILALDHPGKVTAGAPADLVMGITSSTMQVVRCAIRRPSRNTLDFGTGSGIQALLAAPHSDHVYAVDCSRRAVHFGRFNARLNGIDNIEFMEGDGFEPVRGM